MHINTIPDPLAGIRMSDANEWRNEDTDTASNRAFIRGCERTGVAGQYSHIQLLNPAGSGITAIIDAVWFAVSSSNMIRIAHYDTALAALEGNWFNKSAGGTAGACELRKSTEASYLGTQWLWTRGSANNSYFLHFKRPILLEAGEGLVVVCNSANLTMDATFEGREV